MIDGKVFKFGYGDIAVGAIAGIGCAIMTFRQFKPTAECGGSLKGIDVEWISDEIALRISYQDYKNLKEFLDCILKKRRTKKTLVFTFKDYTFDFTNYNEESVKVCRTKLDEAMTYQFLAFAS